MSQTISGKLEQLPKAATYDGNPTVKKSYVKIEYTPEQVEEIARCATDIVYFAENFVYIVDPDKGKVLVQLREYQRKMLVHLANNRFSVFLASRQIGKSTIAAIFVCWYMIFNADKKIAIVANKGSIAGEIFMKVRIAYERLPYWLQVGVVEWQKTSCTLENGSKCSAIATTEDGLRGLTCNVLFLDEFAFVKRGIADSFFTSVYPTISASLESKIIIVSTPNGLNHYHTIWHKAMNKKNSFAPFRVDWWEVPGRDEKWKEETIRNMGQRRFNQEYGNEFLGSTQTLIKGPILEALDSRDPIRQDNFMKWYEEIQAEHIYVFGVDTAKGTGGDYSVIQIIDITTVPFKQVAVYRNNTISTRSLGELVVQMANEWNQAWVMVENNDIGQATVDYIWHEAEYENLVNWSEKVQQEIGIRSTKKTKSAGNDLLQHLLEYKKLEVCDQDTIYELSKYTEVSPGIFKAEDGENDDCVTSLIWGLFFTETGFGDESVVESLYTDREEKENLGYNEPALPTVEGFGM